MRNFLGVIVFLQTTVLFAPVYESPEGRLFRLIRTGTLQEIQTAAAHPGLGFDLRCETHFKDGGRIDLSLVDYAVVMRKEEKEAAITALLTAGASLTHGSKIVKNNSERRVHAFSLARRLGNKGLLAFLTEQADAQQLSWPTPAQVAQIDDSMVRLATQTLFLACNRANPKLIVDGSWAVGPDFDAVDCEGVTALERARQRECTALVERIESSLVPVEEEK